MDKVTSEKNKKKILSKIYRNNPDTYASYKLYLRGMNQRNLFQKSENTEQNSSHDPKGGNSLNPNQSEAQQVDKSQHTEASGVAVLSTQQNQDEPKVWNDQQNGHLKSETNLDLDNGLTSQNKVVESNAPQNQVKDSQVYSGALSSENTSLKREDDALGHQKQNADQNEDKQSLDKQGEPQEDMFSGVRRFLDRVDSENIIGCMIILASKSSDKSSISPVAGGIVEVFDDYERSIQTVWINNNIGNYVKFSNLKGKNSKKLINTLNDQILSKVVLSTLTLRLCAHAYQMTLPNSKRIQHKSRLISIYHQMGQTFPKFAYSFIREEMQFSKHYEITALSIKHNDNPKIPCRCLKPTPSELTDTMDPGTILENSPLFFGITESRFSGMYNSTYEPILIGFMNLLSGKLNDISKIVRFEESVSYYDEDDDFKAKRQKLNYRSRRLQNRLANNQAYNIANIRNIGISAHIDSGKTTLTERILYYSGKIDQIHEVRGNDGVGAKMDSMDLEREKGITIQSAVTNISWTPISSLNEPSKNKENKSNKYSINIIDTPGHVDFTIEVERSLRVLDSAILLVCAVSGVQSQTITVFRQMERYRIPRIIFINKLDREGASVERCVDMLTKKLGVKLLQLQVPIGIGPKLEGVVDIIEKKGYYFRGSYGDNVVSESIPENLREEVGRLHFDLLEKLADNDDDFAQKYLDNDYTTDCIRSSIRKLTLSHTMYPLLMGSAKGNKAVQPLMDAICHYLPAPSDMDVYVYPVNSISDLKAVSEDDKIVVDSDKNLIGYIFKILDTYLGQLSYIRVYKGTLRKGVGMHIVEENRKANFKKIYRVHANEVLEIPEAKQGEIVAISGLKCQSGVTVTDGKVQVTMQSMYIPDPVVSIALKSVNHNDLSRLSKALSRFQKEDPTFKITIDEESKETILSGMGELHLNIYLERMKREYDLNVQVGNPVVNYREAVTTRTEFSYTHKRQSGGAGQYAKIIGYFEPVEQDPNDFLTTQFVNKFVGNEITPNYITSIENGFKECSKKGLLCGRPLVNTRFILTDGASHEVDSSDLAFKLAAFGAFQNFYGNAEPVILEPIMGVEVTVPNEFQSQTLTTLTKRKGIVTNTNVLGESVVINVDVPLRCMFGYITDLRSATKGQGEFTMEFKFYQQMSKADQDEEMKNYQKSLEKK
nr:elongation factor g 1, mitochondrial [Theileria orientalis]